MRRPMRPCGGLLLALALALCSCKGKKQDYTHAREELKAHAVERPPEAMLPLGIDFDGKVKLLGYEMRPARFARAGQRVRLTLYWQLTGNVEPGSRLYTHLLDGSGERIGSFDEIGPLREPKEGQPKLPPEGWEPGKVYLDELSFRFPGGVKTEEVQLVAGIVRDSELLPIASGPHDGNGRGLVAELKVRRTRKRKPRPEPVPATVASKLAADVKIQIDGKLGEPAWKQAETLTLVDVASGEPNLAFPVNGSVKLVWSDQGFYVGFEVKDASVVGGFDKASRDPHLWTRDAVEIMVDPEGDGDNLDYYEIQLNPQNLVFDSRFDSYNEPRREPDGPFGHQDWSSKVKSAVHVHGTLDVPSDRDEGYVVEALIPWTSFNKGKGTPPALGAVWRMNFYAMQDNGGVAWSPILQQGNFHKASRFGRVSWGEPVNEAPPAASGDVNARLKAPRSPSVGGERLREGIGRLTLSPAVRQTRAPAEAAK